MRNNILIIIAILIVAGFIFYYYSDTSPYWKTKTSFGEFQEELIITYDDGTTQSLKLLTNPLTTYKYSGQSIIQISYRINALATAQGFTSVEIDMNSAKITKQIISTADISYLFDIETVTALKTIPLSKTTEIYYSSLVLSNYLNLAPSGDYVVRFFPRTPGTIRYRGIASGEQGPWQEATLPMEWRQVTIKVEQNTVTLILDSKITNF